MKNLKYRKNLQRSNSFTKTIHLYAPVYLLLNFDIHLDAQNSLLNGHSSVC